LRSFAAAALAVSLATAVLNPFDVVKAKLQAQGQGKDPKQLLYRGTRHCFATLLREEGLLRGLYAPGLAASIGRDVLNGGVRIGCYPWVKKTIAASGLWADSDCEPLSLRLIAGCFTGAIGAALGNPFDIVKIRFQTESGVLVRSEENALVYATGLYRGATPQYASTLAAIRGCYLQGELGRGIVPSVLRAAVITAAQVCSYEGMKERLREHMEPGMPVFMLCGLFSGGVSAVASAPIDLVKTRVMADRKGMMMASAEPASASAYLYSNAKDCLTATTAKEGVRALWKGVVASFLRLGPHFSIAFPLLELIRTKVFGLGYF